MSKCKYCNLTNLVIDENTRDCNIIGWICKDCGKYNIEDKPK